MQELTSRVRQSGKEGVSDLPLGQYSMDYLRSYVGLEKMDDFDATTETLIVTTPEGKNPVLKSDPKSGLLLKI